MIRCVRLWTGTDDASHVQIGRLDMRPGRLEGSDPWRRMYVVLADGAHVPFVAD